MAKPRQKLRPTEKRREGPFRPGAEHQALVNAFASSNNPAGWVIRELQSTPALWAYAQEQKDRERKYRRAS